MVATHVAEMPPAFTLDLEPTIALANQVLVAVDRLAQVRNLLLLRFLLFGGHLFFLSYFLRSLSSAINYCSGGNNCSANAGCTYTGPGTFSCACNAGYNGTGYACTCEYFGGHLLVLAVLRLV